MKRVTSLFLLILASSLIPGSGLYPSEALGAGTPVKKRPSCNKSLRDGTTETDPELLIDAAIYLLGGGNPKMLASEVVSDLRKTAMAPKTEDITDKTLLATILEELKSRIGPEAFATLAGTRLAGIHQAVLSPVKNDLRDQHRAWGWKLLPDEDATFNDPKYLHDRALLSRQSGIISGSYASGEERFHLLEQFNLAWSKVAPTGTHPIAFTQTGTDANNLLYDLAAENIRRRTGEKTIDPEILFFSDVYGGGRGKVARFSRYFSGYDRTPMDSYRLPSPMMKHQEGTQETEAIKKAELEALTKIRDKVKKSPGRIGGVFLEPIMANNGVLLFRREFLMKLRALCDELNIPIFADEILTGGGRTGKFFAYEHYEGFEPDFVTFGKGLQVSGVAAVDRPAHHSTMVFDSPITLTNFANPDSILKGTQVLKRIGSGRLIENAAVVGRYYLEKLKQFDDPKYVSGMGFLISGRIDGVRDSMGRLLPPLTMTIEDVDGLFQRP